LAANNKVRIGGGNWRSRLISFPDAPGLRPTPDRVRQTLFNWLGQDLHGWQVLDLFAGTGVMGFEALSRGAALAVMVEKAAVAYKSLQANQALLPAPQAQILHMDAMQFLSKNQQQFDLILVDPPYNLAWLDKILPLLSGRLTAQGLVYVEAEYALTDSPLWQVHKYDRAGQVHYHLLRYTEGNIE
jgi:16S rRNA (guanine966-N2)-methyltransferase